MNTTARYNEESRNGTDEPTAPTVAAVFADRESAHDAVHQLHDAPAHQVDRWNQHPGVPPWPPAVGLNGALVSKAASPKPRRGPVLP